MGIRGLSTFVDLNHHLLSDHKLHDTKVVIDGNNLFHFLWNHYKVSQMFGGDYDHFSRKCKHFFNILHMCQVRPYVVFDGGYDPNDRKLPTILERMKRRMLSARTMSRSGHGNVMPVLAQETFIQVLKELGVPHVSCQYEADREIAVLANRWQCPVMSNDSDFFVFGLEGGFMPFDYVNLTLCVCNSKTGDKKVLKLGQTLNEDQFVYIPVKLYKSSRFVKNYGKDMETCILPLFATILGNDYMDSKLLEGFYANLHVPKKSNKKFAVPKLNTRMSAVLKWLNGVRNVETAVQIVLIHLPTNKREDVKNLILASVEGYTDLENFADLDLQMFLEMFDRGVEPSEEMFKDMSDFYSNPLPDWFVIRSRKCEIAGALQNVAVLHRVIRLCQVETISEPSTYACCRGIIEVISGLIFGQNIATEEDPTSRQNYLVVYDRDQLNIKKTPVHPAKSVHGFSSLPSLQTLSDLSQKERFKLMTCTLGLSEEFVDSQDSSRSFTTLLSAVICYWIRNANAPVTVHHMSSLLIGVLALQARSLQWLEKKRAFGSSPVVPYLSQEITTAYEASTEKQKEKFLLSVEKFLKDPEHTHKKPRENTVIHGFAQFQACLLETIHLNQLLLMPAEPPSPSLILNSTLVYNLCRDMQTRVNADLFIAELLVPKSPFHGLFLTLSSTILDICGTEVFEQTMKATVSSKKTKSKGKKSKPQEKQEVLSDSEVVEVDEVLVNCDISNKFALLGMDE